ncbi:SMR family transporter [Priestia megaterium]
MTFFSYCLSHAMRILPARFAYGVWTGVGSVGITLTGILWF